MDSTNSTSSTNVECKLIREGGTRAEIGGIEYHFAPLPDGAHVCAVENPDHADRFLAITDAYRLYRGECTPAATARPAPPPPKYKDLPDEPVVIIASGSDTIVAPIVPPVPEFLIGSGTHPASFTIHGATYSLGDVVARAHEATAMSIADWNALQDDTRAEFIDEELDRIEAAGPVKTDDETPPAVIDEKAERAALSEKFEKKFNKKPNYRLSMDKLREAVADA